MSDLWNRLPLQVRTIVNVAFAAFLVWAATDGLDLLSSADLAPVWKGLLLAVTTAVIRALNPADDAYGLGSSDE